MYGLCKGKPTPKIAEHKVQDSSILNSWWYFYPRFDYLVVRNMFLFSMFQWILPESCWILYNHLVSSRWLAFHYKQPWFSLALCSAVAIVPHIFELHGFSISHGDISHEIGFLKHQSVQCIDWWIKSYDILCIPWMWPPHSNSGKWRFTGIPY